MAKMAANNIPLAQMLPKPGDRIRLNCCANPDCENFGVSPDFSSDPIVGANAGARRETAARASNAFAMGVGRYKMEGGAGAEENRRTSRVFEYEDDPILWADERKMRCLASLADGPCRSAFTILNDRFLNEEHDRLLSENGALDGPACGACGRRYLEAPEEFMLNGSHQANIKEKKEKKKKTSGLDNATESEFILESRPCGRIGPRRNRWRGR